MNPYPETPDNWIERREEHAPPEGAIWCSDCGEWIEESCEHLAEVEQSPRLSHPNLKEQITRRTGGIIRFRKSELPKAFQKNGWRCSFACSNRTKEQVLFTAGRTRSGSIKAISWQWICSEHKALLQ